jgi:hypothetical protein
MNARKATVRFVSCFVAQELDVVVFRRRRNDCRVGDCGI